MTFKHTKFEDSATMRALVKVAAEKGWVKSEPIEKTASVKEDLSPTNNLTENVIKLCAGLRKSGMDKFADELENKFFVYKQATTMYDVHGEKGDDLIDAAHPKGGHKMENVEGDAFVETVLERHLKILDVVNKKPTGKLASHKDILGAVKIVLGEETSTLVAGKLGEAQTKFNELLGALKAGGQSNTARLMVVAPISKGYGTKPATEASIKAAQGMTASAKASLMFLDENKYKALEKQWNEDYANMKQEDKFRFSAGIRDYDTWEKVRGLLDSIYAIYGDALKLLAGDTGLIAKFDGLAVKLNSYRSLLQDEGFTDDDRKQGNAWITSYINTLNNWKNVFAGLDPDTKATEAPRYEKKFQELKANVDAFYKQLVA